MTPLTPSQYRRFEELLEALANATPSQAEGLLAGESDTRVARLVRLSRAWRPDALGELHIGLRFDKLELVECLGNGGLGVVWRARRDPPDKPAEVAVKFIRPDWLRRGPASAQRLLQLFEQEIAILDGLSHDNIVRLHWSGRMRPAPRQPEVPWVAMEYLRGSAPLVPDAGGPDADLHAALYGDKDSPDALEKKIRCFAQVADAIAYAHARGVWHLDLTPSNVRVLPGGKPKVIDFGLGALHEVLRVSRPELVGNGTLPYRAPEQFDSTLGDVGEKADVHALGVLLYQFLTGRLPYPITSRTGDDEAEIRHLICAADRIGLPRSIARRFGGLQKLLNGALVRQADQRILTAAMMADQLKAMVPNRKKRTVVPKPPPGPGGLIATHGSIFVNNGNVVRSNLQTGMDARSRRKRRG